MNARREIAHLAHFWFLVNTYTTFTHMKLQERRLNKYSHQNFFYCKRRNSGLYLSSSYFSSAYDTCHLWPPSSTQNLSQEHTEGQRIMSKYYATSIAASKRYVQSHNKLSGWRTPITWREMRKQHAFLSPWGHKQDYENPTIFSNSKLC